MLAAVVASPAGAQAVDVVVVRSQLLERIISLPGEILPFQQVALHARVNGYVERVLVDRGSSVKEGELLVSISAPEIAAAVAEAESRAHTAEAGRIEAEARLAAAEASRDRLKMASETPGAIAGNELVQAEKAVDAARASVRSAESALHAAEAAVRAAKQSEQYLQVKAPFGGVITERMVHPGALVGPGSGSGIAMLQLVQISHLRLIVPVPESEIAAVRNGQIVHFSVPAYPTRKFSGTIARADRSLDVKTRTMAVELDVVNAAGALSPGMFARVEWPSRGEGGTLVVPRTCVVTTTERTFVIRVVKGRAQWVNVRKGRAVDDSVEVYGPLQAGDLVVRGANDELREGMEVQVRKAP